MEREGNQESDRDDDGSKGNGSAGVRFGREREKVGASQSRRFFMNSQPLDGGRQQVSIVPLQPHKCAGS